MSLGSFRFITPYLFALAFISAVAVTVDNASAQPTRYELTWVDNEFYPGESVRLTDLNEDGIVVGRAGGFSGDVYLLTLRAIMYDRTNGMTNLNELPNLTWTDMGSGQSWSGIESEWIATTASGITETDEFGGFQIVGGASHPVLEGRAYVLSLSPSAAPQFKLLTRFGSGENVGRAINDWGVVVAESPDAVVVFDPANDYVPVGVGIPGTQPQEISDSGTIVTRASVNDITGSNEGYVITPGESYADATFQLTDALYGINDSDVVCGIRDSVGKGKKRVPGGLVSYPSQHPSSDVLVDEAHSSYFCDINNNGYICYRYLNRAWVYKNGVGSIELDPLVNFSSAQDEVDWFSDRMQPQGINDAGQIIIRSWANVQSAALLTPVPAEPSILISPTSGLTTSEAGGAATFDVVLGTQPQEDVQFDLSSSDSTEGTIDKTSLTFTSANWDAPQRVTITGADDEEVDGDVAYTIVTTTAISLDPDYHSLDPADVQVVNQDNDGSPGGGKGGGRK